MRKRPPPPAEDPSVVMVLAEESPAVHDFPGNVVTPELIQELVSNGSLAPHFQRIHNVIHQAGWQARKQIQTEIEFGSVLAQIQAARQQMSEGGTVLPTPKHIPLLLRAFRKQVDNKAPPNGDAMRTTIQHALTVAQQSLEQWAPVTFMHVVRALSATGVAFQGPILYHQRVSSQSAMVDGQQQLVAFRERTTIPAEGGLVQHCQLEGKVHGAYRLSGEPVRHGANRLGAGGEARAETHGRSGARRPGPWIVDTRSRCSRCGASKHIHKVTVVYTLTAPHVGYLHPHGFRCA